MTALAGGGSIEDSSEQRNEEVTRVLRLARWGGRGACGEEGRVENR